MWLLGLDSNQDNQIQSLVCYQLHYPGAGEKVYQRRLIPPSALPRSPGTLKLEPNAARLYIRFITDVQHGVLWRGRASFKITLIHRHQQFDVDHSFGPRIAPAGTFDGSHRSKINDIDSGPNGGHPLAPISHLLQLRSGAKLCRVDARAVTRLGCRLGIGFLITFRHHG